MDKQVAFELENAYNHSQEIESRMQFIDQQLGELQIALEGFEGLKDDSTKEILTPLGNGIFLSARVEEKSLFVNIGAGVFVKKSVANTQDLLLKQMQVLESTKNELTKALDTISQQMRHLLETANK